MKFSLTLAPTAVASRRSLLFIYLLTYLSSRARSQEHDPSTLNGGSVLAMAGENCIAVAVDKRFGSGPQMVNVSKRTILTPHSRVIVGFTGLEGDVQSLAQELSMYISTKVDRHFGFGFQAYHDDDCARSPSGSTVRGRDISPASMSTLLGHVLYRRRQSPYYVEPIVVGLERISSIAGHGECSSSSAEGTDAMRQHRRVKYIPYLCAHDVIGAKSLSKSFVCSGVASKSMYGTAEAMWRPRLQPYELVRVCGRAFLSALERDCLSGYGATIYLIIGGVGILEYDVIGRND